MCARQLERVGDHAERITAVADLLSGPSNDTLSEWFMDLGGCTWAIVGDTVGGVLEDDGARGERARSQAEELAADLEALDRDLYAMRNEDAYLLSDVHDSSFEQPLTGGTSPNSPSDDN